MRKELQAPILRENADLLELLPRRFVPTDPDCRLMQPTFWCRDGWAPLIREFLTELRAMGAVERGFRITSIKQKFGALNLAGNAVLWPEARTLMHTYAERSRHICEWCGAPGELRNDGYMETTCEQHIDTLDDPGDE